MRLKLKQGGVVDVRQSSPTQVTIDLVTRTCEWLSLDEAQMIHEGLGRIIDRMQKDKAS